MTHSPRHNRRLRRSVGCGLAGVGAILASALAALSCAPAIEEPAGRPPAIVLSEVVLRHYPLDGPPRIARADQVTFDRETAELHAYEITADIPPTAGLKRGMVHLEAASGRGDIHGQRAEAYGDLLVTTGAGDRGKTVGSVWDAGSGILAGDEPLQAKGPGYSIDGKSYHFHVNDQRLEIEGGIHAISRLAEAGIGAGPEEAP